jgi:hypothetical protein
VFIKSFPRDMPVHLKLAAFGVTRIRRRHFSESSSRTFAVILLLRL